MDITLSLLAFALSILGIIGCIVPALPGVVLSYAGLLCAYFTSYSQMSASALWLWLGVTVAVSVADYFLPAWMTRRFGGSRAGAIGGMAPKRRANSPSCGVSTGVCCMWDNISI